jgi:alpha-L-fucosidase
MAAKKSASKKTARTKTARQKTTQAKVPLKGDAARFIRNRFGMFIHWGTYAAAARHEWVKNCERIPDDEYQKYFDVFDPDLYDPAAWARAAKNAGMKYFVITAKHHEGFCLWDTKYTDYKAPNAPCGKDLLRPMIDAFRAEGLRVGLYYSLIDWHHPDYPVDSLHPMRENEEFKKKHADRDVRKYAKYMRDQVTELLTQFGEIDYIFYDFSFPGENGKGRDDWESVELMKLTRKLQPHILIDNRLDLMDVPGGFDVVTPEQHMEAKWPEVNGERALWETCQTFSGSWGYHREEATWKSVPQLLYLLIDTVSKGGNLLLNVGPTARGTFDARALSALSGMGEWMKLHDRSITGCTQADGFETPPDTRLTYNPETNRLYVHFLNWPIGGVALPKMAGKIKYAQLLNDASEITFRDPANDPKAKKSDKTVVLNLPLRKPEGVEIPVIELFIR